MITRYSGVRVTGIMADQDVSLSKKTIALMVLSCLVIVFLLRPSRHVSDAPSIITIEESSFKDSLGPISETQPSDPSRYESATEISSNQSEPSPLQHKDMYLFPPSQEWIQKQFQKALSDLGLEYSPDSLWSSCGPKTYYFQKINTIFTGIPKTGCTHWIESLLRAEGDLTRELAPSQMKKVHGGMSNRHRMRSMKRTYNDTTFRNAFSFTVLRNPWTRMVSGYRDKLSDEDSAGADKRSIGVQIVQLMRHVSASVVKEEKLYPTFAEYAAWLVKYKGSVNVHFSPQIKATCLPRVKYDMVIPLEYTGPMGGEVLRKINASKTSVLGSYDKSSDPRLQSSALYAKKWLSALEPDLVEQLYSVFKTDFELLNYSNFSHPDFPLPLYNEV